MAFDATWTWAVLVAVIACHAPVSSNQTPPPATNPAVTPIDSPAPYQGPAVTLTLNGNAGAAKVTVEVTFSTGGWSLKHDSSLVKDGVGVAHLTFNAPGPDDMVAQMLDRKEWAWKSAEPFSRGEVWVRIVKRGQTPTAEYRLAAKAP
jgi:hypothetical protein